MRTSERMGRAHKDPRGVSKAPDGSDVIAARVVISEKSNKELFDYFRDVPASSRPERIRSLLTMAVTLIGISNLPTGALQGLAGLAGRTTPTDDSAQAAKPAEPPPPARIDPKDADALRRQAKGAEMRGRMRFGG